jgi:hypothetical protein
MGKRFFTTTVLDPAGNARAGCASGFYNQKEQADAVASQQNNKAAVLGLRVRYFVKSCDEADVSKGERRD